MKCKNDECDTSTSNECGFCSKCCAGHEAPIASGPAASSTSSPARAPIGRMYIAGPLFSQAEREFNLKVRALLLPFFDIYLPQLDGPLVSEDLNRGMGVQEAFQRAFTADVTHITNDYFLMLLDGRTVDEGAAFELGVAWQRGAKVIGLKTDERDMIYGYDNPMIHCACPVVCATLEALEEWALDERVAHERALANGQGAIDKLNAAERELASPAPEPLKN